MICIKRQETGSGDLLWTAEDADGVIGQITVTTGSTPAIILLDFEEPEIGDGLIKTAAAFFASAGIPMVRFSVGSESAKEAALAAGFVQTPNGLELDPAHVKRACKG